MVKLSAVGSAQEVAWLRMPAKRLAIGPGFIPHEHVIVLDPSMRSTSLIHVSHDYLYNTDLVDSAYYSYTTASPFRKSKVQVLRLPDPSAHRARNSSRHSPSSSFPHNTDSPSFLSQRTNTPSDRQEPSTGSLPLSLPPVGTATTPLNKP